MKYILTTSLLIFAISFIGFPLTSLASDEVSFDADTNLYIYTSGYTVKVMSGSVCDELVVYLGND